MSKKVYVAYTGGTIGMLPSEQGYKPAPGYLKEALVMMHELQHQQLPEIVLHEYDHLLDSANMQPDVWWTIARDIENNYDAYDGFVVLHGTDTLAYTASALSFMLENLNKPVICTGSQIPLCELRSDGPHNIVNSLLLAAHHPIPDVCIYFGNVLLRGNRSTKINTSSLRPFASPNYPCLAEMGANISINTSSLRPGTCKELAVHQFRDAKIASMSLFPGISGTMLDAMLDQPLDGLVLMTYGAGNAPVDCPDFLSAIEKAIQRGIVIVNCTQCLHGSVIPDSYATASALTQRGVLSGGDMTHEAALTKLFYLLSTKKSYAEVCEAYVSDLRGEVTLTQSTRASVS